MNSELTEAGLGAICSFIPETTESWCTAHCLPREAVPERKEILKKISVALEKEMATHSSVLAWRTPGTGEPGGLPSMGSHGVGHN